MGKLPHGLKTLTIVVRALTAIGGVGYLCVNVLLWWQPAWMQDFVVGLLTEEAGSPITIDDRARWLGALGVLPRTALSLFAMWHLWRLFGHYGAGRFFDRATKVHLLHFSWAMLLSALLAPVERTWTVLALTLANPPGQQRLSVSFGSGDFLAILFGAVMLAIAIVLAEAVRLAEENEGFV